MAAGAGRTPHVDSNSGSTTMQIRAPSRHERAIAERGTAGAVDYYRDELTDAQRDAMRRVLEPRAGAKVESIAAYGRDLAWILRALRVDPKKATKADVERALREVLKYGLAGGCRKRISLLRALLKTSGKGKLLPPRIRVRQENVLREDQLLQVGDVQRMIDVAPSLRDRAFLAVTWESAGRIHEVLGVRLGDVYEAGNGEKRFLKVFFRESKVAGEEHAVLMVEGTPFVRSWLNAHPLRGRKDAPLFVSGDSRRRGRSLSYAGALHVLRTIGKAAGVTKEVRPHAWRHARITYLLRRRVPEQLVKKMVGLSPNSQMLARYGHLVTRDVDNAMLALSGQAELPDLERGGLDVPDGELVPAMPADFAAASASIDMSALAAEISKAVAAELAAQPAAAWHVNPAIERLEARVKELEAKLGK